MMSFTRITVLALAIGLAFGAPAGAFAKTKADYLSYNTSYSYKKDYAVTSKKKSSSYNYSYSSGYSYAPYYPNTYRYRSSGSLFGGGREGLDPSRLGYNGTLPRSTTRSTGPEGLDPATLGYNGTLPRGESASSGPEGLDPSRLGYNGPGVERERPKRNRSERTKRDEPAVPLECIYYPGCP